MQLEFKVYDTLCAPEIFYVNEIQADERDFGQKFDRKPDEAEPYCCADMRFTRIDPALDVLLKYRITKEEYFKICDLLEEELSWGECGWCE